MENVLDAPDLALQLRIHLNLCVSGAMRDVYQTYVPVFIFCAAMMALCAAAFALEPCVRRAEQRRRGETHAQEDLEWDHAVFEARSADGI